MCRRRWGWSARFGPFKELGILRTQGHQNKAGPELRHSVVCRLKDSPFRLITELGKGTQKIVAVLGEFGRGKAGNILKEYGPWFDSSDKGNDGREHVAVVVGTKLLACDTERGTWNTSGKQVYASEFFARKVANILVESIPARAVLAKRTTKFASYSTSASWWNPAISRPSACPPPPAQSSIAEKLISLNGS